MLSMLSVILFAIASPAGAQTAAAAQKDVVVQTAANTPENAAGDRNKMICKRFVETGSLVKGRRVCQAKWEWERDRDLARASVATGNGCRSLDGRGGC